MSYEGHQATRAEAASRQVAFPAGGSDHELSGYPVWAGRARSPELPLPTVLSSPTWESLSTWLQRENRVSEAKMPIPRYIGLGKLALEGRQVCAGVATAVPRGERGVLQASRVSRPQTCRASLEVCFLICRKTTAMPHPCCYPPGQLGKMKLDKSLRHLQRGSFCLLAS